MTIARKFGSVRVFLMQLEMYVTGQPHSPYMLENRELTVLGIFQDATPPSV
jgi:hypothetical protein